MKQSVKGLVKILFTLVLSLAIGAVFILAIGESPLVAYGALLKGAFGTKLGLGTTLAGFTPLMVTAIAFAVAAQAGAFNVGVEGEVILGGITAAYIGVNWGFLPAPLLYLACFLGAMLVAAAWALIPAVLKAYYQVSEVCVTILMNTVALYIASYLVSGPMSAGTANPQSDPVLVTLPAIMKPSSANAGIFIAIIAVIVVIFMLYKTRWGYKIRTVGTNPEHAQYVGINAKKTFIYAMLLSGMLGGLAGCIEVLGVHGYYLDGFAKDLGTNGMLAALIVKSNMITTPFMAFFLAVLKSGAMAMQQSTGVPKAIVDTISAVFIIVATMEFVIQIKGRHNKKQKAAVITGHPMPEQEKPETSKKEE
ncbi:MAG: ABC transporter permease [Lachnospiraceae bacterium]|nr:ABC transporter permease [Lachnospiraceae bacterium]